MIMKVRMLDNTLKDGREYLCCNRFTIADICVTYALYLGTTLKIGDENLSVKYQPQTTSYMERMLSRDGYLKACKSMFLSFTISSNSYTLRARRIC